MFAVKPNSGSGVGLTANKRGYPVSGVTPRYKGSPPTGPQGAFDRLITTMTSYDFRPARSPATNPKLLGEEGKRRFFTRKVQSNACLPPLALGLTSGINQLRHETHKADSVFAKLRSPTHASQSRPFTEADTVLPGFEKGNPDRVTPLRDPGR
jgi:hypothetical protein